jgi:hypothetical protein
MLGDDFQARREVEDWSWLELEESPREKLEDNSKGSLDEICVEELEIFELQELTGSVKFGSVITPEQFARIATPKIPKMNVAEIETVG